MSFSIVIDRTPIPTYEFDLKDFFNQFVVMVAQLPEFRQLNISFQNVFTQLTALSRAHDNLMDDEAKVRRDTSIQALATLLAVGIRRRELGLPGLEPTDMETLRNLGRQVESDGEHESPTVQAAQRKKKAGQGGAGKSKVQTTTPTRASHTTPTKPNSNRVSKNSGNKSTGKSSGKSNSKSTGKNTVQQQSDAAQRPPPILPPARPNFQAMAQAGALQAMGAYNPFHPGAQQGGLYPGVQQPHPGQYAVAEHHQYSAASPPARYGGVVQTAPYAVNAQPGHYSAGSQPAQYGGGLQPAQYGRGAQPGQYGGGPPAMQYGPTPQPLQYAASVPSVVAATERTTVNKKRSHKAKVMPKFVDPAESEELEEDDTEPEDARGGGEDEDAVEDDEAGVEPKVENEGEQGGN